MRKGKITILALIFIILGSYVYFFEIEHEEKVNEPAKIEKLLNFSPEKVQEIVLNKKGQRILLKKEDNQWKIKEPVESIARTDRVLSILSVFDYGIVREITTNPTPSELSDYGLDRPEIELEIKVKGEDSFQTLVIGGNSPSESCCYGKLKNQPRIVLLGIRYKMDLDKDVRYFVD